MLTQCNFRLKAATQSGKTERSLAERAIFLVVCDESVEAEQQREEDDDDDDEVLTRAYFIALRCTPLSAAEYRN